MALGAPNGVAKLDSNCKDNASDDEHGNDKGNEGGRKGRKQSNEKAHHRETKRYVTNALALVRPRTNSLALGENGVWLVGTHPTSLRPR